MKLKRDHQTSKQRTCVWSAVILGVLFLSSGLQAQTFSGAASNSAIIQPAGLRPNSTGFFNVEGSSNNANASFAVADFTASSFNINFPVTSVSNFSISLTENNASFTRPASFNFYLTTDTGTTIGSGTSLTFNTSSLPEGLGTQLSPNTLIGTGTTTSSGNSVTNTNDVYNLTLNGTASMAVVDALNGGGTIRLIVTPTTATAAATWYGSTATNPSFRPTLNFSAALVQPSLSWVGGSGSWDNANTNWRSGSTAVAWDPTKLALFATGSGTVSLTDDVTANAARFDVGGYTIASSTGKKLSLSTTAGGNQIGVTNAADSATISATISGTTGLEKSGAGTLILSGANDFTGDVKVSGGTLQVTSDAALGAASNGVTLNATAGSATFKALSNLTVAATRAVTGTGSIDAAPGTTLNFAGTLAAGALTFTNTGTVAFTNTGATTVTGVAVVAGGKVNFTGPLSSSTRTTLSGDGSIQFSGDNSAQTGGFQLAKGTGAVGPTVIISDGFAFGNGNTTLNSNAGTIQATTALIGGTAIQTKVSFGGDLTLTGSNMEFLSLWSFFNATPKVLTVLNTTTIDAAISNGSAANTNNTLAKAGAGILNLLGANTYTGGTQVRAGQLIVKTGSSLGTGDVSVAATATANTILELDSSSSISDTANVILSSLSGFYGRIFLNFSASEQETVYSLTVNGNSIAPGDYSLAANNLPNYLTGTGVLHVLAVVPEPSTALLLSGCGLVGLLARRRVRA